MINKLVYFTIICNTILLTGCSTLTPYTAPVEQGKDLPQNVTKQLRPGMTKDQIKHLLGTPDIVDPFEPNQWNYIHTHQKSSNNLTFRKELIITFKENKVTHISGNYSPPDTFIKN